MSTITQSKSGSVRLQAGSPFYSRMNLDLEYLLSLRDDNLLQNFYYEAGLGAQFKTNACDHHHGWEDPTCQLRGHFLGHWLSAAAWMTLLTGDVRLKAKVEFIVSELARCQQENGGRWAAPIPEKYLDWIAQGKAVWAPHYTMHKVLMGLVDVCLLTKNETALAVLEGLADWFDQWSRAFSYEKMQDILDYETGGMMEAFADLYSITGKERDLRLMHRYARTRYFDCLLQGEDVLTNMHANTTIPEVQGACRAYEVTGEQKWLNIAQKYWEQAVLTRGAYVTGSQTMGEIWTPKEQMGARLGGKNQEHCVAYNMIRLADYLYRVTGDKNYQDYIELSLYNGVLAQCFWQGFTGSSDPQLNPQMESTIVCYFLPLEAGAKKPWGSRTDHFWCCHGSAVQACSMLDRWTFYVEAKADSSDQAVIVNQYVPSSLSQDDIALEMSENKQIKLATYPQARNWVIKNTGKSVSLKLRVPAWCNGAPVVLLNGEKISQEPVDGYLPVSLNAEDAVEVSFGMKLEAVRLPGSSRYAFRFGPFTLAGIIDRDVTLKGSIHELDQLIKADYEREWSFWLLQFRTTGQAENFQLKPLCDIGFETYTTYFEIESDCC